MELMKLDRRAELEKMSKAEIIDYIDVLGKNFWSLQNNWMANVTMRYGSDVAAEFDEMLWGKWSAVEAHRFRKLWNLGDTLADVVKVMTFSLSAEEGPRGGISEFTENRLAFKIVHCPMQIARQEAGWPELNCKPAFEAMWRAIISVINPGIELTRIYAPHDPHSEDDWCGAVLELKS
ncbi:MAG: hypothetical protein KKB20_02105 [Proteobacteria bacterium]|nr:hypothetical protein [Pseudomonadota bacterium]